MSLCSASWHDVLDLCYDFWMRRGFLSGNILCTKQRCYRKLLPSHYITWNEAQHICKLKDSNLVTINSFEELQLLRMVLLRDVPLHGQNIYIGLQLLHHHHHQQQQQNQKWVGNHKYYFSTIALPSQAAPKKHFGAYYHRFSQYCSFCN